MGDYCADAAIGLPWRGIVFRQSYPELEELIFLSHSIVPACWPGSEWFKQEKTWHLPTGATLRMRSLERSEDATHVQGHSHSWIGWDELCNWPDDQAYRMVMATLRSAEDVPHKRIRASANPSGPGMQWVKARFVDPAPMGYELIKDPLTGMLRVFIPSRVTDNKALLSRDPTYIDRLRGVGSPELVRAWLEGDWSAVVGAYFPEFGAQHIRRPFDIPAEWLRFRALDWGSARPTCCLWCAVSDGEVLGVPRGALVVYREMYLSSEPNVGLRMTVEEVADRIRYLEMGDEPVRYSVADPAIFAADGGPSIGERFAQKRLYFKAADNRRVGKVGAMAGWDLVRQRLKGEDDQAMLLIFSTCTALIRTLPAMQHDARRPEDLDTTAEDHACFVAGTIVNGEPIEKIGRLTRCDTETTLVRFDDGFSVECTPDHRFLTETGAWVRADRLATIRVSSALPARSSWASAITSAAFTFSAKAVDCIALCGSTITDLCRMAFMFITPTTTDQITGSATSRCGPGLSIFPTTANDMPAHPALGLMLQQPDGIAANQVANGTVATGNALPRFKPPGWLNWFARCAANLSRRRLTSRLARASATSTVGLVRCVAVERQSEPRDVYCLATNDGWVRLANGVIAANCDALRYACASRPWIAAPPTRGPAQLTLDALWEMRERERASYH